MKSLFCSVEICKSVCENDLFVCEDVVLRIPHGANLLRAEIGICFPKTAAKRLLTEDEDFGLLIRNFLYKKNTTPEPHHDKVMGLYFCFSDGLLHVP